MCPIPVPCHAVPCRGGSALHPGCAGNFIFFFSSSQNRDIVENWQWQEGSGATTHSTPVLNSSSVPRVVAIRGGWPAWLTFKVNCLISATYYIITANAAHPHRPRSENFTWAEKHREMQTTLNSIYTHFSPYYKVFRLLFTTRALGGTCETTFKKWNF